MSGRWPRSSTWNSGPHRFTAPAVPQNPKLAEPNIQALELGYAYAGEHFPDACNLSVRRSDRVGDAIIMDGNTATALGALYAGATVVGWYPITPSTSIIEAFGRYAEQFRIETETGRHQGRHCPGRG
jgi:2-oxoglutarate/2-oxoacid ferredoxin oxidoreductase subunit alpha